MASVLLAFALSKAPTEETPVYGFSIKNVFPHDPSAFTQGLVYADGILYESTGLKGRSTVRRVEIETGRVHNRTELLPMFFGEGIALVENRIYQLTWTSGVGFVYDKTSLRLLREFRYGIEGWGMTYDGKSLIVSDGSANLYFWDPGTLAETRRITVRDRGVPVGNLNELEIVEGEIWANVWQQDRIARISSETGNVLSWVDLSGLLSEKDRHGGEDVLNGIAYDPASRRLFVTGKLWPRLFEIEVVPRRAR